MSKKPSTFVIGDVHGCYDTLRALIAKLPINFESDHLWLTGDLVNRGPKSLKVLRWARKQQGKMGKRFVTVLGNHDLHLLGLAAGTRHNVQNLERVLAADDRDQLLSWLRRQPVLHRRGKTLLVHAGLWPKWDVDKAERRARKVEQRLRAEDRTMLFPKVLEQPGGKLGRALYAFTLLRMVDDRHLPCSHKGPPASAPKGCRPWYAAPDRHTSDNLLVFGHWAALGLHLGDRAIGLDSGCAWGGSLTAMRLADRKIYQQRRLEPT